MMHTADRTYLPGNTPQQRAAVVAEREEGVVGCLELVGAVAQGLDGHPLAAARHNVLMALLVHSHSTAIAAEVALFAKAPARTFARELITLQPWCRMAPWGYVYARSVGRRGPSVAYQIKSSQCAQNVGWLK
jgi:hypothetical protein